MAEKFDPAPHDKHAANPGDALCGRSGDACQTRGRLVDSFPASDPVSAAQPAPSKPDGDRDNETLWDKVRAVFR